jgi:pyridoxine 5-phosphate synthase
MPLLSRLKPLPTPPAPPSAAPGKPKTTLSVNINKVALLRNSRHIDLPNVARAAELCLQAGAQGITVHPRPDERHIRPDDVYEISALMKEWPHCEFNIEGNPFQNLMHFVRDLSARGLPLHQCTFVPDSADQFTSDHGWTFPDDAERLRPLIEQAHARGVRVSLFMDPVPEAMAAAKAIGADRVEFYTESYAQAATPALKNKALSRFVEAARAASAINLGVNAGHDLNRENLTEFLRAVPGVLEVSIGHALIADALELGYAATVKDYLRCIDEAFLPLSPVSPVPPAVPGDTA